MNSAGVNGRSRRTKRSGCSTLGSDVLPCSASGCLGAHDRPRFHRARAPSQGELERLLDSLIAHITRALARAAVLVEESLPDGLMQSCLDLDLSSPLEQLSAAAGRYRITVGRRLPGARRY